MSVKGKDSSGEIPIYNPDLISPDSKKPQKEAVETEIFQGTVLDKQTPSSTEPIKAAKEEGKEAVSEIFDNTLKEHSDAEVYFQEAAREFYQDRSASIKKEREGLRNYSTNEKNEKLRELNTRDAQEIPPYLASKFLKKAIENFNEKFPGQKISPSKLDNLAVKAMSFVNKERKASMAVNVMVEPPQDDRIEQRIYQFVKTFLEPYLNREITKEMESENRKPLLHSLKDFLGKDVDLESESLAIDAYFEIALSQFLKDRGQQLYDDLFSGLIENARKVEEGLISSEDLDYEDETLQSRLIEDFNELGNEALEEEEEIEEEDEVEEIDKEENVDQVDEEGEDEVSGENERLLIPFWNALQSAIQKDFPDRISDEFFTTKMIEISKKLVTRREAGGLNERIEVEKLQLTTEQRKKRDKKNYEMIESLNLKIVDAKKKREM